ncbi:spermatogenesis associated 6-like protein isoform X1 [Acipenser oxyrinchus oxyrinchus]|uniref:Spermatogenesis associated 6-like protein isoform X1 n=1 Tax=Acipenser oxyrinchus oxyrinchus TaxID=40147 RepID=A0AAD8GIA3_ACIOX|nr:spermatogenesis associated 6-like protein isoform X1 [Acipenser oxyrinchus oxyrinchus]
MPQKAVKVVVELQLHAVTCPGVFLTDKDDVYLSVCIMGQYRKSACCLPVFPLLFHEKMTFEKVFKVAMDPAAVAEQLEYETAKFELIQLFPPVGETLASYEEEARSFLFPEPKLSPTYPGVDREVLMRRTRNFPGIAPKLEFSTRTTIKECSFKREKGFCANNHLVAPRKPNIRKTQRSGSSTPSRNRSTSPGKKRVSCCIERNYEKQTNVSRARSLSLCANKRVAEDFELNRLGLAQLNLGPHKFKSDKNTRSHFQIYSRPVSKHDTPPQRSPDLLISRSTSPKSRLSGDISFGSHRQKNAVEINDRGTQDAGDLASMDTDDLVNYSPNSNSSSALRSHMRSPTSTSILLRSPSLILNRSPLRQRFNSDSNNTWESIHDRVRNLLTTHSARQRLSFGATESEVAEVLERRSISPSNFSMEKRN